MTLNKRLPMERPACAQISSACNVRTSSTSAMTTQVQVPETGVWLHLLGLWPYQPSGVRQPETLNLQAPKRPTPKRIGSYFVRSWAVHSPWLSCHLWPCLSACYNHRLFDGSSSGPCTSHSQPDCTTVILVPLQGVATTAHVVILPFSSSHLGMKPWVPSYWPLSS